VIKVIRKGTPPEETPIQVECRRCRSVLEFVPASVKRVFDQRDGDFYQFLCPVCGTTVTSYLTPIRKR